ncbi:unnamed protein product [Schistosoma mattheei]|uniref:Uncharacterized protein n=1 Tax=Schistosoma mattheei TaxID=31246 RepID=A0A3P8ET01_9TREM|nr:unnamed protein product [Schistosoma mattheei]
MSILRRQLFINACIFLMMVVLVPQISAPYSRPNYLNVLVGSCFEFHMLFNCRDAALALKILAFMSASEPTYSSMILPS